MRALLIANPNAGQRRPEDFQMVVSALAGDLVEDQLWTTRPGDARRIAMNIAATGAYDAIFVAGGDGTVNEVASGILLGSASPETRPAIGILPMGTCNVLANELGVLLLGQDAVRSVLENGARRAVDVGRSGDRFFLLMAGYGFDAAAARRVALPIKGVIGAPAYVLSALATLAEYEPSRVTLGIDDDRIETSAFMVVVANVSSYAYQQLKLAPYASMDDGWLDICVFETPPVAKVGFAAQVLLAMANRHLNDPRVRYYRARRVTIESEPQMPAQFDGDALDEAPTGIEVMPRALEFFVPNAFATA